MKVLVINQYDEYKIITTNYVPCVGTTVDMFFERWPKVTNVIAWPSNKTLEKLNIKSLDNISVIVMVE